MSTPAPATPEGTTTDPGTQPATPPAPPAAPTPPEPAAPANTEPSEPNQPEPKAKAPKFEGDFDPARFEKLVENLRGDVAAEKAKREALEQKAKDDQDTLMKRVATAFGLETDEAKPPTPEELAKQLDEAQNRTKASDDRARQTQVELAVYKTAGTHGGDPDALLDSRSFAKAIEKLDPSDDGFGEAVAKAVKTAVDSNSKLAAKAPKQEPEPTPAGGAPMDGAGGGKRQLGAEDRKRMTPEQIAKAVKEGRFAAYLGGGG
ncbi:hypothetical protein J7F02_05370 [Streptomyces sp. ISL-112]|uniref:hypothetical protein n=1 Tax=unclassified Streptomyces TaxID=2593676 RepID=UPI001BE781FF|nr:MULTISPECIES: hypothetical protein [unclassified Streptomyces]MBT2425134.1 hypothetical protein [Streptomyces sp. ISL-112]MBT2464884.1 hypothetical protein [Streptomyces sp. ISL-63]